MSDSDEREALAAKREQNSTQRIDRVKQWVEYIESTPVERWGPQQNSVVDSQLEAVRASGVSADHLRRVDRAGRRFRENQNPRE